MPTQPKLEEVFEVAIIKWVAAVARAENVKPHVACNLVLARIRENIAGAKSHAPKFNIEGCESGRITSAEPNFTEQDKAETDRVRCEAGGRLPLDHLPEGSH